MAAVIEELFQDAFSPASSTPENFMEQTLGGSILLPARNDCQRDQSIISMKSAAALSTLTSSAGHAADPDIERLSSISRLSDYYVFGLAHIII